MIDDKNLRDDCGINIFDPKYIYEESIINRRPGEDSDKRFPIPEYGCIDGLCLMGEAK